MPYVYKRWFLDTQYGIRKDGVTFKIGDSPELVDQDGDITIKETEFRGSECCGNVNKEHVTSDGLRKYKKILLLPNAHLEGYKPGGVINVVCGKKIRESIAQISPSTKAGVSNQDYAVHGKVLRWPPVHYITIRPNRKLFRL